MSTQTIDHNTLSRLVEAGAVRDARVVGQAGGWGLSVHADSGVDYILTVARKSQTRLFRKMDTLIVYLKGIGISRFTVDASSYAPESYARPDRSTAMKETHEAAAHDKWFREEVEEALRLADSPDAVWIPHEEVRLRRAKRRAEILAEIAGDAA